MQESRARKNCNSNKRSDLNPSIREDYKKNLYDLEININSILGFLKGWI